MRVFTTILLDSMRLLKARALFWVSLGLSLFAGLIFLSTGFSEKGISLMFGLGEMPWEHFRRGSGNEELFYMAMFSKVMIGFWLSWGAIALALISCAPVFPDFMAEGSIGLAVSKPLSRLRLFVYKYLGSMLFVVLQTLLFCVLAFIAIRWRLGIWKFDVFWAVPLLVLVFSYLYSVVVWVGVHTRSVLASILAGFVLWFIAWGAQWAEGLIYQYERGWLGAGVEAGQKIDPRWHQMAVMANAPLPKTSETVRLMDRWMTVGREKGISESRWLGGFLDSDLSEQQSKEDQFKQRMSPVFIIGSSLGFELVLLALAARTFCRKDF